MYNDCKEAAYPTRLTGSELRSLPRRIPVGFAHTAAVEDSAHQLGICTGKNALRNDALERKRVEKATEHMKKLFYARTPRENNVLKKVTLTVSKMYQSSPSFRRTFNHTFGWYRVARYFISGSSWRPDICPYDRSQRSFSLARHLRRNFI